MQRAVERVDVYFRLRVRVCRIEKLNARFLTKTSARPPARQVHYEWALRPPKGVFGGVNEYFKHGGRCQDLLIDLLLGLLVNLVQMD